MYPQLTISGDPNVVLDFLVDYCDGDTEQALDLYEGVAPYDDVDNPTHVWVTVDFVLRKDRPT